MSIEEHKVSFSLEVNTDEAYKELRKVQTLLFRSLSLASRLTGSEDLKTVIRSAQQAIMMLNQLRLTMALAQAAAGPVGWALLGVSAVSTALTAGEYFGDMAYDMKRGYG